LATQVSGENEPKRHTIVAFAWRKVQPQIKTRMLNQCRGDCETSSKQMKSEQSAPTNLAVEQQKKVISSTKKDEIYERNAIKIAPEKKRCNKLQNNSCSETKQ
jgi:hypothetical protein